MKLISLIVFLLVNSFIQAQESKVDELLNYDFYLEIDSTVLNTKNGMFYYNRSNQDVVMIAFIANQSFDIAKTTILEKENSKRKIDVISTVSSIENGFRIIKQIGEMNESDVELHAYCFLVETNDGKTFFLVGMTKSNLPDHINAFNLAVNSFIKGGNSALPR